MKKGRLTRGVQTAVKKTGCEEKEAIAGGMSLEEAMERIKAPKEGD